VNQDVFYFNKRAKGVNKLIFSEDPTYLFRKLMK